METIEEIYHGPIARIVETITPHFKVSTVGNKSAPVYIVKAFFETIGIDKQKPVKYSTKIYLPGELEFLFLYYEAHSTTQQDAINRHNELVKWVESPEGILFLVKHGLATNKKILAQKAQQQDFLHEANRGWPLKFHIPVSGSYDSMIADNNKVIDYLTSIPL